jgi:hypothetical protein
MKYGPFPHWTVFPGGTDPRPGVQTREHMDWDAISLTAYHNDMMLLQSWIKRGPDDPYRTITPKNWIVA